MLAQVFQHVPFEGPGHFAPGLRRAGFQLAVTEFFAATPLPDPESVDFLLLMGGPMSVNDEALFPWLQAEKEFIRRFSKTGKPMLGVCLGAQLIASAFGARVYPNPEKEIGWFPITDALPPDQDSAFRFPPSAEVFHWHGETFDLPPGAVHLARSRACENQAFQLGRTTIGLQFHLETTPESAQALIENARAELVPAPFVQSEAALRAVPAEKYLALNRLMDDLLAYLLAAPALRLS